VNDVYEVDDKGAVLLCVHAQPGAGRSQVVGRHGDALKIRVAVPPVNDRANVAIAALLAEHFGVAPKDVTLVSGAKNRQKRFRIAGVDGDDVERLVDAALAGASSAPGRSVRDPRHP